MDLNKLLSAIYTRPLLYVGIFSIITILMKWLFKNYMIYLGFEAQNEPTIKVDEHLPYFFHAISPIHIRAFEESNRYQMEEFQIQQYISNPMDNVNRATVSKYIESNPWYNILSSQYYLESFCYIGPHIKDRHKLLNEHSGFNSEDCDKYDLVLLMLRLPFIPE